MVDFHVRPLLLQVFGYQAAMALLGNFFAAQQAGAIELGLREFIFDAARRDQVQKLAFVCGPKTFVFFVGVQHFFGGSEVWDVKVLNVADSFGEVAQIFFFGEGRQLGYVVQADIDETLYAGVCEAGEENFRGLFCETDGKELHGEFWQLSSRNFQCGNSGGIGFRGFVGDALLLQVIGLDQQIML
jgi:hypothetical protein